MGDDVIRVRLQIDQNTARSVEGQVRNLVSRLNNQRITLTFNTSAINSCIAQLERLEQTARRIQSSNIDINANLTQSQQSYRLETERIRALSEQQRIAQQIEVERERTLQSENNAISALSRENRTLTVNRNLTENINGNVQHIHEHLRNAGNATNDFVTGLGRGLQHLIQYRIFSELLNKFNEGFQELKSTDDAMVSLKKVTDETDEKYNQFLDLAREKADRLARSVSSVVDQTARWAKLGFNTDEAAILSETSSIYANVGEVSDETAVSDIVTAMKAFNIEAKDSIQIIDKLNNLGNKYALTSADLGEGLSKSASALKFAGNDINQTLAMITGGTEIVQDASITGNALKVLSMRIRGMKGELEELGEEYENVESISKIQTQILNLTHGAVNIFDNNGNFRSTYNILEDIAEVWERISQTDQAALLETIAGKQRGNQISALIQSFQSGQAQKAYADAINSSGSALKEQEKWLDSIEAKQQKVSTAWANYIAGMSDVEMVKGSLDLLAASIDALDSPLGRLISQMVLVNTALALTGRLWNGIRARSIIADTLAVGVAEGSLGTAIGLVTEQLGRQALAWISSPLGMATVAAVGIYAVVKAVDYFTISLEESREALSNLKSEYSNIKSELQGLNDELQTTRQRLAELESKDKLTFTEAEELENLRKQNNELERQKDLLEMQEKIKLRETNKAFVETMSKDVDVFTEYRKDADGNISFGNSTSASVSDTSYSIATEKEFIEQSFKEVERLRNELSTASTEKEKERIQKQIDDLQEYYNKKNTEWQTDSDGIEYIASPQTEGERKVNEYLDLINDFQDHMAIAMGGTDAKTNAFNRIVDSWQFDSVVQGLQDLGEEGKVTAEMLNDPKYDAFIQKLVELGVIDTADNLDEIALAFNNVGTEAENSDEKVNRMTISLDDLKDASDSIASLQKAFDEMSEDGYVTTETLSKIKEAVGDNISNWDEYQQKLLTAKKGSAEFNQVLSDLTYAIIENKFETVGLENATEEEVAAILRENGVLNANEVAHDMVTRAKIEAKGEALAFAIANNQATESLYSELEALGLTKTAATELAEAYRLAEEKMTAITKNGVAERLKLYGIELEGIKTKDDALLAAARGSLPEESAAAVQQYLADMKLLTAYASAQQKIDELLNITVGQTTPTYSSSKTSKSSSSTDKDKPDKADPTDAIINRIASNVEALERQGEIIDNQLDMVDAEKEYDKYVELTNKALDNRLKTLEASKTAQNELSKEAQKIRDKYKGINVDSFFDADGDFTEAYNKYYDSFTSKAKQEVFEADMKMIQEFKKAWFEYYDDIMGLEKEVFDLRKDLQETHYDHLSNLIDQLERHAELQEKQSEQEKEYYDYLIEKTQALLDIKKAQFSLENKLISAQREAEKALATSKIGSEYLDEETRKLVYNDDDYKLEMDKIKEISDYVEGLTDDYISDINRLGDTEIYKAEEITAQYERRLALKEKELEIVQAEVDLQKKQDAFNNILAEKNIRQIVDGKWVWTHDTDQLRQATEDLADAKAQVEQLEREKTQLEYTNSLEARIGHWQLEQEAIDLAMEDLNDKIEDFSTKVELLKDPLDNFADIVNELTAELGNINIESYTGGSSSSGSSGSSSSLNYGRPGGADPNANVGSVVQQMMNNSTKWYVSDSATKENLHNENQKLAASIGADYNPSDGKYYQNGKPLYDNGGVLKGLGGIKATEKDEVVLSPSLTEKILTPENNLLFDRFANNLETIFDVNTLRPLADMFNIPKPNVGLSKNITDRAVTNNYNMNGNVNITEANDIEDTLRRLIHAIRAKPIND